MEPVQIDLYEFLTESELQHYYNSIKNELKISNASQFKYATDEDLKQIGLSRPEIRRLRKYYEKYFPHGYLSKIKRLLQAPATIVRRDDGSPPLSQLPAHSSDPHAAPNAPNSPGKGTNNKHIIPADSICVNKQLGTGEFGIVQQGVWTNGSERIQVAIKCLCRERMQSNPMEFLKEAAIMHSIEHENIVRLYGVVLATDSLMLVTELAHLRSLLECLKDSGLRVSFLTIPTLCEFAVQICNGMKYLEYKRLIHRDLAARNILVFSKNKVKISDFGLSRALGVGKDYYKTNFNVNLKLPIAWCAPECINYLRFTNASDVWAYGVCLWEMFSYGFQPWAALTGLQILEAIDAPNFQRLEQPECCPRDYYQLMMKCWQDDPVNRPKFSEIYEMLPEIKPEQLKAVFNCCEAKKDHLLYRQGDIITVLDRNINTQFWKGALNSGKTGLFNPANTVAYLESLPSSNRDSFSRTSERCSKRKLRTEMISKPQNDLKHTGHMGIDGDSFGDVAFLVNSQNYNHLPRQIVTPYKPSEDIEQTPLLLPPTPTSPDSLQTASSYFPEEGPNSSTNPTFVPSNENTPKQISSIEQSKFDFSGHQLQQHQQQQQQPKATPSSMSTNPFTNNHSKSPTKNTTFALQNNNYDLESSEFNEMTGSEAASSMTKRSVTSWASSSGSNLGEQHEYHEISDDDGADKFDFGPSLLEEINSMFGSIGTNASIGASQPKSPNLEHINIKNELAEYSSKLNRKSNAGESNGKTGTSKKKGACSVKPISVKDEKILNQAIEIANEISARSMTDLVCEQAPSTQSPKRKFSFRFPHLSHYGSNEKSTTAGHSGAGGGPTPSNSSVATNETQGNSSALSKEKKNFTEELKNIPDLQTLIGEEGREAYKSLIERKTVMAGAGIISPASLLSRLDTNEFELASAKTFPRRSVHLRSEEDLKGLTRSDSLMCASQDISIPHQNTPRPLTLPSRRIGDRLHKSEIMLNSFKKMPEFEPKKPNDNTIALDDTQPPCESPSYLTNTLNTFPENVKNIKPQQDPSEDPVDSNPIPLPPREGKKHIKSNPKRHVRKYPLIIPAYGVQRTLNKVTEVTPIDDEDSKLSLFPNLSAADERKNNQSSPGDLKLESNLNLRRFTHEVVAAVRPTTRNSTGHDIILSSRSSENSQKRSYQNVQAVKNSNINEPSSTTDPASLQFESILEDDLRKVNVLPSPDVTDGFYNFSIQKDQYNKNNELKMDNLYVNEDELRNLDVNKNVRTAATKDKLDSSTIAEAPTMNCSIKLSGSADVKHSVIAIPCKDNATLATEKKSTNELVGNALFKKVRESVDNAMNQGTANSTKTKDIPSDTSCFAKAGTHLKDSNSVSCEDLLEFSDKKPKGCERGVDSDEVRIMMKVLGKDTTPTRCLHVLEFIDWDVHKAIKLIKLQNILGRSDLSLTESVEVLQEFEWDLQITAMKFKGLK